MRRWRPRCGISAIRPSGSRRCSTCARSGPSRRIRGSRAAAQVRAVTGPAEGPCCATYFTDASILKPAMGDPAVMILGPGSVDQPHGTDEHVLVSRLAEAVEIYAALIAAGG